MEESDQIGPKATKTLLDFVFVSLTSVLNLQRNAIRIEGRPHCAEVSVSRGSEVVVAASPIYRTCLRAFHHLARRNGRISFSIRGSLIWVSILTKNDTVGGSASGLKRKLKGF
jgi:hypothetical protein